MEEDVDRLYCSIGIISKPRGLKGDVKVTLYDKDYSACLEEAKIFFIKEEEIMIPYFIKEFYKINTNLACIKIDGINDRQKTDILVSKELFMLQDVLQKKNPSRIDKYLQLLGFVIVDSTLGHIGVVNDIISYPHQNLASLIYKERSVLIPLVSEFIIDVNYINKCINMNLPIGLLDI